MKNITVMMCALAVALYAASGAGLYPTVEEAEMLFSSEALNSTNVHLTTTAYIDFAERLKVSADAERRREVESCVINAFTSIVICVSTNLIDDSVGVNIAEDRGAWLLTAADSLADFRTNDVPCLALAAYLGRTDETAYQTNLVHNGFASVAFFSTDANERAQWLERRRHLRTRTAIQARVFAANKKVKEYRHMLFLVCGKSVAGCRASMTDGDFTAFTNKLVTVSGATETERSILFEFLQEEPNERLQR